MNGKINISQGCIARLRNQETAMLTLFTVYSRNNFKARTQKLLRVFDVGIQPSFSQKDQRELTAQSLSSSYPLSKEYTERQFMRAHLKVVSRFVTTYTRSPL